VASGVPRLDYYTSGGTAGCPALLVEPSAANGILDSADTATNWQLGLNLSSGYVDVIGVSGNNLTVAVSGSGIGSSAGALRRNSNNVALASGSTYTLSFFLKKTGAHTIGGYYAAIAGGAAGDLGAGFNVSGSFSSGQIYNTAGTTSRIRRVEQWGTDVYRCSETFTMLASGTLTNFFIGPTVSTTDNTNPAVGAQLAFAAPQIELGSVPTTFIPTTTAAVTRNADVVTLSGAVSGCIGQTEGTIYAEVDVRNFISTSRCVIFISDDTTSNCMRIEYQFVGGRHVLVCNLVIGGVTIYEKIASIGTNVVNGILKIAFGYKSGNNEVYQNGAVLSGTVTGSGTFVALPNIGKINLGSRQNDMVQFNDRIRSAALYTTRLTDSELAALTTL
jgi:hypothetical protein